MRIRAMLASLAIMGLVQFPALTLAAEAARFTIRADGAKDIVFKKDHYSVSLVRGWISSKDSFFKALLSKKDKLVVSINSESMSFDGDKSTLAVMLENTDINKNTDRPWGVNKILLDRLPGDSGASIDLKLAIHRNDTLKILFDAIKSAEPTLGVDLQPWIGYSNVVTTITTQIFGTNKTGYPFTWTGDVKLGDISAQDKMPEHYVILISPNRDGDPFVTTIDAGKLSYDEKAQQLRYDGQQVTDHSYAVLKVTKTEPYAIAQLLLDSRAPWAVLGVSQFLTTPVPDARDKDQLAGVEKNLVVQLKNEIDLLNREHRFSAYDRAVALYTFSDSGVDAIRSACKARTIADQDCPTTELVQFRDNIGKYFALSPDLFKSVPEKAKTVRAQAMTQMK